MPVLVRSLVFLLVLAAGSDVLALEADPAAAEPSDASGRSRWASSYDVSKSDYRLSLGRGALDVGLRVEARGVPVRSVDSRFDAATPGVPLVADLPSLSIGLRSMSLKNDGAAGSLVDRAFGGGGEAFVSKVGIAWKPAQSRVFLNQGLGIRFDGDDRLTVRLRKGSLGLYMQTTF